MSPTRFEAFTVDTDLKSEMVGLQVGAAGTLAGLQIDGSTFSIEVEKGQWWGRIKQISSAPANTTVMYK